MPKALAFRLFLVLLALVASIAFALPAASQQKKQGAVDQEACDDAILECVVGCTFLDDDVQWEICNQDCNEDFGICSRGDGVAMQGGSGAGADAGQSDGVLGEANLHNVHVVRIGLVGEAQLERACTKVKGVYSKATNAFGCVNRQCEAKGSCTLVCYGGNCLAITPGRLLAPITLLGILQNGDKVHHGPLLVEEDTGGGDDDGSGGCGLRGGCNPD
jgi:hypothetical protein